MTWLPNLLTLSRIVLLLPVMGLLAAADIADYRWAFALFLAAGLTDLVDGWAARRLNCVSNVGAFLDPLADKIMSNVLLVFLACRYPAWIPLWMVLLLLAREFAVQGFRSMAPCLGVMIRTERLSKLKTLFQLIAAGAVIAGLGWESLSTIAAPVALTSLILALASGYISMTTIFIRNADLWSRRPLDMESR
ncbi:CDP-alcohol phosphatidyltransferase family protein [Methylomicrobium sp. RS1]|jgi:CDP-diacylglycerol--glycerol-3-phosphate 3-phosphatidyltransferase|uniref:CDP-alcohol phosphatidyltransferase family protein n=1 Tax=Candidatus Methylomicrobium oryzae TaxID=2802053 RepID=UPI0019246B59|nr:CDP-alcohol phosphatidyltransferase family protein [Methylomicrobium sp. RS1]MBL1264194.1 CDP-alcohol phosphatidyltransferase family protein [Methylomicrobium sp. RS1]